MRFRDDLPHQGRCHPDLGQDWEGVGPETSQLSIVLIPLGKTN